MNTRSIIGETQIDKLKEAAVIGAGHSADTLSQLLSKKVTIDVPEVKVIPLEGLIDLWESPESMAVVIYMNLMGKVQGKTFLMFSRESAFVLLDLMMKRPVGQTRILHEMDYAGLKEMGNMIAGSFVTALSGFLDILWIPSVPLLLYDMYGAIMENFAIEFGIDAKEIFTIRAKFEEQQQGVNGEFVYLFNCQSFELILEKLEMKNKEMTAGKDRR